MGVDGYSVHSVFGATPRIGDGYGCGGLLGSFCVLGCAKNFALALSGFLYGLLSVETSVELLLLGARFNVDSRCV